MTKQSLVLIILLLTTLGAAARDGAPDVRDRVRLSASAEREVANDRLVAVLYAEHQSQRQAEVSTRVNAAMAWALALAKGTAGLDVQTLQYSTWPVYGSDASTITGWRARQSLRIEGADAEAIGELVAKLQERLAVESVAYTISREARRAAEDALIADALARFSARAGLIATSLGRPGYSLVQLDVGVTGQPGPPMPLRAAMMADVAEKTAPAQFDPGEQTLGVTVSGTVQLDAAP